MTTEALSQKSASPPVAGIRIGRWARPAAAIAGIWLLSLLLWWLLIDPKWGVIDGAYPQPAAAYLFWVIGIFIIAAFNFGGWPFAQMRPYRGGALAALTHTALGVGVVLVIVYLLGRWDHVFSPNAPGESGFLACALIVLPGFYCWTAVTAHWGNWPFSQLGQPLQGLGAFLVGAFMTMAGFFILVHPELAGGDSRGPFRIGTAIGWLYSVIVIALLFPMIWENRPWSRWPDLPARALVSVPLCFGLGTGFFFLMREVLQIITPDAVLNTTGFDLNLEVGNLGVCFSVWALTWGLLLGSPPAGGRWLRPAARTALVAALAIATYVIYMRWFATQVLHEPAYDGRYGGFALLWMDWLAMILLWYAVSFGAPGLAGGKPARDVG